MGIKRGDMPSGPQSVGYHEATGMFSSCSLAEEHGLTIREQFAMAMAQGFVSTSSTYDLDKETIAIMAVEQADALLAELERTK